MPNLACEPHFSIHSSFFGRLFAPKTHSRSINTSSGLSLFHLKDFSMRKFTREPLLKTQTQNPIKKTLCIPKLTHASLDLKTQMQNPI